MLENVYHPKHYLEASVTSDFWHARARREAFLRDLEKQDDAR